MQKSFSQRKEDVTRDWLLMDADNKVLGRFASEVAQKLIGKHKPTYTPHTEAGDYVVVINAAKISINEKKLTSKKYYSHSGFMGGLKIATLADLLAKSPEKVIEAAVYNMLPKNKLRPIRMNRLKVYAEAEHTHQSQIKQ